MVHWVAILSCLLTESAECANNPPRNPPMQTQQISKSTVYCTRAV